MFSSELQLVVAILLPRRLLFRLGLRLLRVLLLQHPTYFGLREWYAVLCVQLPGLCGVWAFDGDNRISDGLCVCEEDIWRYQGRLREHDIGRGMGWISLMPTSYEAWRSTWCYNGVL